MGVAPGLRAAGCEPFGRGLSGAAREQRATVEIGPARTVGGVLLGPRGTRTANGRGVCPPGSGTRLEPSSADRPHPGWAYVVVAVWLRMPRRARRAVCRAGAAHSRDTIREVCRALRADLLPACHNVVRGSACSFEFTRRSPNSSEGKWACPHFDPQLLRRAWIIPSKIPGSSSAGSPCITDDPTLSESDLSLKHRRELVHATDPGVPDQARRAATV